MSRNDWKQPLSEGERLSAIKVIFEKTDPTLLFRKRMVTIDLNFAHMPILFGALNLNRIKSSLTEESTIGKTPRGMVSMLAIQFSRKAVTETGS